MSDARPADTGSRDTWASRLFGVALAAAVLLVFVAWITAAGGLPDLAPRDGAARPARPSPSVPAVAIGPSGSPSAAPSPSAAGSPTPTTEPSSPSPSAPSLDPVFGMSGHLMWHDVGTAIAQLDMLRHDGLGVVRFDVSWRGLEPQRGQHAYLDKLDAIVDAAIQRGIRPVISIVETPGWANGGQSAWVPPDDPADYAAFAGFLAGRYAGRVDAWEVWNEPDIQLFWRPSPDPAAYARLLIAASRAIHAANPSAIVVGGSVTFGNVDFVKALYDHGAKGSFDALSVHPYTLTRAPDDERDRFHSLTAILDDVHQVMTDEGDATTPIWVTELGWAVVGLNSVSADARVSYLRQSVDLIRQRAFVKVVTVYTIDTQDSERYGLSTSGRRSAAWQAYVDEVRTGER